MIEEIIDKIVLLENDTQKILFTSLRSLLWWQLATLGLTFGITHSKLFKGLRKRVPFIQCPQCVGFWAGLFVYFLDSQLFNLAFGSSFICFAVYFLLAKQIKNFG